MQKNMQQWRSDIVKSRPRLGFPLMSYVGLDLTGMNVLDVVKDGKKQAICIQALAEKFPASAGFVTIMDLSVEAEAFGAQVKYAQNETPTVIGQLIGESVAAASLKVPEIGSGRTGVYLEAAALASKSIAGKPLFGCVIGPFSLAGRLCDMTRIFVSLMEEPETVHIVLEKCARFLINYAKAFKDAGAQGIFIAEPAAGLISPRQCQEFSSNYVKKIISSVKDENFTVVLHNCGNTRKLVPAMLDTGAHGYHFGNAVDMIDILPQIPAEILAFGNIDPSSIFRNGTPAEVKAKTIELLERMSGYHNFVPSSGCDIPPGTPVSNLEAFFAALEEFKG
jgi:uroporphyrinogen decarboxylase